MTKRCPMCGKKMLQIDIDGRPCRQCPKVTCLRTEPIARETETPAGESEITAEDKK